VQVAVREVGAVQAGAVEVEVREVESGEVDAREARLRPGVHRYAITYRTERTIRFLDEVDELYWNVTGNFWAFPIDQATARVTLPPGANILRSAVYTGAAGAHGKAAVVRPLSATAIEFATTAPLGVAEGLTIAVAFPKGIVAPSDADGLLLENAPVLTGLVGVVVAAVYFLVVWLRVGRDPRPGPIIPRFAPPDGLPPATLGYLHGRGYDDTLLAATLTNLAVRRHLRIEQTKGRYSLSRTAPTTAEAGPAPLETAVADRIFADGPMVELSRGSRASVVAARTLLEKGLKEQCEPAWIRNNFDLLLCGIAIVVVALLAAVVILQARGYQVAESIISLFLGSTLLVAVVGLLTHSAFILQIRSRGRLRRGGRIFMMLLFLAVFAAGGLGMIAKAALDLLAQGHQALAVGALTVLGVGLCSAMAPLLKATTPEGARLRDETAGLRMFLTIGERERLEALHPPKITPAVFERFLPYAIALGCQNEWAATFAASMEASGYAPDGWSSSDSGSSSPSDVADFSGPSLAAAAAETAASDRSGADGASDGDSGSSGGGDGGGGGGGE
jgi:uncharacterized membrane protein YgcG